MRLKTKFLVVLFSSLVACYSNSEQVSTCIVTKIIDGDTLYCSQGSGKEQKIRLIGIDAPESKRNYKTYRDEMRTGEDIESIIKQGKKSKTFLKSKLPIGTKVRLELDVQLNDKYGRTLAYIYLPDGTMLNELMVREGYAQIMSIPPNVKYQELLRKAQKHARENRSGVWSNN